MDFSEALIELKKGKKLLRKGWNGAGIFIELQTPTELSKMTLPYLFINTEPLKSENDEAVRGKVPWLASQTDILCDDWEILK